ncbi:MAG: tetratricopeptide repeat protein [Bacteroidia bacterium]
MKKILIIFCLLVQFSFAQTVKLDSLQKMLTTQTEDSNKVNTLINLSRELLATGDYDTSNQYAFNAASLSQKIKFGKGEGRSYNIIGIIYMNQGNYPEALKNYSAALKVFKEIEDNKWIANCFTNIGEAYRLQGNYSEALKKYFAALKIREEIGDKNGIDVAYNNIGIVYMNQGNYPEALKNYFTSLKIREEDGNQQGISVSYNNIGEVYGLQGDYAQALKNHLASLKIKEKIGDKRGIAYSYGNIGIIYYNQRNYAEALRNFFSSLKISEEIGEQYGVAYTLNNIGDIYTEQHNYHEASRNYFAALKIFEEIGHKSGIASCNCNIGIINTRLKKYTDAKKYLNNALLLSKKLGLIDIIKNSYSGLTVLDSATGNWKDAFIHEKLYVLYRDSLVNEESTKKTVQTQMQYEFDKKQTEQKAVQEKKDVLTKAEIAKQKLIRNSTFGGVGLAGIFSFLLVHSFNRKNKASFEKQISDVEMKALRSQMNPHFIFNSLHSINKFMMDNDKGNASEFLSKFSKLMRAVLENSREREVSLEKDLSALELYMQLESLRFQNKFQYKIEVDENIDKENTLVPPLMLQPFVENSIIHGISNKDNGMIQIKIKKENDMIHCSVEDNGIGREEAMSISSTEKEKSKSLAMNITHERISILNQLKKAKAALNIFDLKDAENNPAGLRVELNLPLELAF